jgi:hypothetical protein
MKFIKTNFNLSGSRGQMGAPVELLVAVIIMSFVIIISSQVLYSTNRQVCKSNVEKEVYEFKSLLEDTAKRNSLNNFVYFPDNPCFEQTRAVTNVVHLAKKGECLANCGQPVDSCWVIQFDSNESIDSIFIKTCLEIPAYTKFLSDSQCEYVEGYSGVSAREKLPFGQYLVKTNVDPSGSTTDITAPEICTLYKRVA